MTPAVLVDTHVLLWWRADDARLSESARRVLGDEEIDAYVSAATLWEIAIKSARGQLTVPDDFPAALRELGFLDLEITAQHAWAVRNLPELREHRDPFDRMLIAQATCEGLDILTADTAFDTYGIARRW